MKKKFLAFLLAAIMVVSLCPASALAMNLYVDVSVVRPDDSLTLDVETTDTIEKIKAKVQDREGIPPDQQHIYLNAKRLEDNLTLGDYNVQPNGTLTLKLGPLYDITDVTPCDAHGTIELVKNAAAGAPVEVSVTPDRGYALATLQYNDGSDHTITANGGVYSFVMPAKAVTVTATFEEHPHQYEKGICECGAHNGTHTGWTAWANSQTFEKPETPGNYYSYPTVPGSYYLTENVRISGGWPLPSGEFNICLNGYTLTVEQAILIDDGSTLNLFDCNGSGKTYDGYLDNHLWKSDSENDHDGEADECDIEGGMLLSFVNVAAGVFNMYGGTIAGNSVSGFDGGGVYNNDAAGEFHMHGGAIIGNTTAKNGGGVYITGTMTMDAGLIANNTVGLNKDGGGVYVASGARVTMTGGKIADNYISFSGYTSGTTRGFGGGVFVEGGYFELGGTAEILGNTLAGNTGRDGGGVYLYRNTGSSFVMHGGRIAGNMASGGSGGGVYIGHGCSFTMTGGTITGNSSYGSAGVYGEGSVSVGGTAVVQGNYTCGKLANSGLYVQDTLNSESIPVNMRFYSGFSISEDVAPRAGMSVGLYDESFLAPGTLDETAVLNASETDAQYFTSDDEHYGIAYLEPENGGKGELRLARGGFVLCDGSETAVWNPDSALYPGEDYARDSLYSRYNDEQYGRPFGFWMNFFLGGYGAYILSDYEFTGWYTERTGGTKVGEESDFTEALPAWAEKGKVYYAHWKTGTGNTVLTETLYLNAGGDTPVEIGGKTYADNARLAEFGLSYDADSSTMTAADFTATVALESTYPSNDALDATDYTGAVYVGTDAAFVLNSGSLAGNTDKKSRDGGNAVCVNGGSFVMNGGCIENNSYGNNYFSTGGGGVYVGANSTFTMNGGELRYNEGRYGGGVFVAAGGIFSLHGGNLFANHAERVGGGVCVDIDGTFTANGGTISGNDAYDGGGGVYVVKDDDPNFTCLAAGTPITLADGTKKPIEQITGSDVIRVFDHETGELSTAKLWNLWKYAEPKTGAFTLHFTNGIDVTAVGGHCFFEKKANKYIVLTPGNAADYIGSEFYNADDACWETLVGVDVLTEAVDTYVIVSEKALNALANGMLSNVDGIYAALCNTFDMDENLRIDAAKKAADLEKYGLWEYGAEHFPNTTETAYHAQNLQYLGVTLGKGLLTKAELAASASYRTKHASELIRFDDQPDAAPQQKAGLLTASPKLLTASPKLLTTPAPAGIFLGGTVQITCNTCDGTPDNLLLWDDGRLVKLLTGTDAPKDGFFVGVSLKDSGSQYTEGRFTENGTAEQIKFFTPDGEGFYVAHNTADDGYLELKLPDTKKVVTVLSAVGGVVYTDKQTANADDTVTLTVLPNEGYLLKSLKYYDNTAHDITGSTSFTMPNPAVNVTVVPEFGKTHIHREGTAEEQIFFEWNQPDSLPTEPGNYALATDVMLSATWTAPAGTAGSPKTTNLCLNGHVIVGPDSAGAISVPQYAELNLYDCDRETEHSFGDDNGLWIWDDLLPDDKVIHTATGGVITGGAAGYSGGGVLVNGTFTMYGGNIIGNKAGVGSGVYVNGTGSFTMHDGVICGNTATTSTQNYYDGGGVYVTSNGCFYMDGGVITENKGAGNCGGGVHFDEYNAGTGKLVLGGTAVISGNTGNDVYLGKNGGSGKLITIGDGSNGAAVPADGMSVGVITVTAPVEGSPVTFTTNGTSGDVKYFFADPDNQKVKYFAATDGESPVPAHLALVTGYMITDMNVTAGNGSISVKIGGLETLVAEAGETVVLNVVPEAFFHVDTVTVTDAEGSPVNVSKTDSRTYTFTMPDKNVSVAAAFAAGAEPMIGYGGSASIVTVPVSGNENSVRVEAQVSGSTAAVKALTDDELAKVTGGESVEIDLTGLEKEINTADIPAKTVEKIADKDGMSVRLTTATVTFDKAATQEISEQAKGSTVRLVVDDIKEVSLNAVQKEAVKKLNTALIIDAYLVSNGTRLCTESRGGFGSGKATVALPYEIKNNRTAANYSVYYVDDAGNLEKLAAKYDAALSAFVFDIEHFSNYVVAFNGNAGGYADCPRDASCPIDRFTDTVNDYWWHDGIHYCLDKGLMIGVSDAEFVPNGDITRAMIVMMLWRMDGQKYPNYAMRFTDVAEGQWYTEAVRWAAAEKVVSGYTDGTFRPDAPITREELATILYNYAKYRGEGFTGAWMFLLDFVDRGEISDWSNEAVHWCSMKGVVNGKHGKVFDPQGKATRAEAAAMMQRFCEALEK